MQKSYECEVATHIGPESCGAVRVCRIFLAEDEVVGCENSPITVLIVTTASSTLNKQPPF